HMSSFEPIFLGVLYQSHAVHHVAAVETEVLRQVQGTPAITSFAPFDRTVTVHKAVAEWDGQVRIAASSEPFDAAIDRGTRIPAISVDTTGEVQPIPNRERLGATGDIRLSAPRPQSEPSVHVQVRG